MRPQVLEKQLSDKINTVVRDVTPGVLVRAYQNGKMVLDIKAGHTSSYYDWASLTKIVFTVQRLILDFENGKWAMDTKVGQFVPWFPHPEILIRDILSHSAGFIWWLPIYNQIDITASPEKRRAQLKEILKEAPIDKKDESVYSDIGMLLLGFVLEEMHQKPLLEIWKETKEIFYPGTTIDFSVNNEPLFERKLYAASEECGWRKKLLRGEVHDDNTWALGGVSTHAGLFGSIDDLGVYLLHLRSMILGIGRSPIRMKTVQLFVQRARPEGKGDWALGYMLPSPGMASCGQYFSLTSVGHLGFTGTSVWYDRDHDLGVVILSNRTLYGRDNTQFKTLRSQIHDWIVEGLRKASY